MPTADREYLHGPGYVDDVLVQVEKNGTALFIHQDASHDVVSLTNIGGTVVRQIVYSAAGTPLIVEDLGSHPPCRIGHHGLFFEKLNTAGVVGSSTEFVSAASEGVYYNRNRWYDPGTGRFIEQDPNATGVGLLGLASRGGMLSAGVSALNVESMYGDGANLFEYLGSNSIGKTDPGGLFLDLFGPTSTLEVETDEMQRVMDAGRTIQGVVNNVFVGFAATQSLDADWATDWSRPDSDFSGSAATGSRREATEGTEGDGLACAVDILSGLKRTIQIGGKAVGRGGNWHHVIPKYLGKIIGNSGLLVKLPVKFHKKYHAALDRVLRGMDIPHMRAPLEKWAIWIQKVGLRKGIRMIKQGLREATAEFSKEAPELENVLEEALKGLP